jgi:hypothetical protein
MAPEIEGEGKAASDIQEAVGKTRRTFAHEKIGAREAGRGALAMPLHQLSVENLHTVSHGAFYGILIACSKAGDGAWER